MRTDTDRHGLKHLGGNNDRLASLVTLRDHHLLSKENLARRDLNTEVTTGNHDTVGLPEDFVEVEDTLLVLDFDDDFDVGAVRAEDAPDVAHVLRATDERGEDHVDAVLDTELEVGLVLLGERGQVDVGLRQVDTLARAESAVVQRADAHILAFNGDHKERQDTIINVDELARCGDLRQVFLRHKLRETRPAAHRERTRT